MNKEQKETVTLVATPSILVILSIILVILSIIAVGRTLLPGGQGTNFITAMQPDSQGRIQYNKAGYITINIYTNSDGHVMYQGRVKINKGAKVDINKLALP